jgi:hypothetical protein
LIHLGVDFGTCWSKLVMRDYESPEPRAFVVRAEPGANPAGDYRIPSAVVERAGVLHFGHDGAGAARAPAANVIRSPKMLVAGLFEGEHPTLPGTLDAEALCSLVVAYLLRLGERRAREYCAAVAPGSWPKITMTIGAPMASIDDETIRGKFIGVARNAFEIWRAGDIDLSRGISLAQARVFVAAARERVALRSVTDPREWVRSEAEAGLLWAFKSPQVGEGLYACVDVGAGTTDVSFFRIRARFENGRWPKDGMVFYSATSGAPGVDKIDLILAENTGGTIRPDACRSREAELLNLADAATVQRAAEVAGDMHGVYQRGWRLAYDKERTQTAWDPYKLFLLGGGSQIPALAKQLERTPWKHIRDRRISHPGFPDDLFECPEGGNQLPKRFTEDATFLLVAYGLSWLGADVPPVAAPNEVPNWRPPESRKARLDQDELYPR